jgi:uncharacterized membrane protein
MATMSSKSRPEDARASNVSKLLSVKSSATAWWGPWRWRAYRDEDASAILKRRLASGQITEGDYRRLKQVMSE